jgi:hypothetical protein
VSKPRIALIVAAGFSCEAALPSTQKLSEQFLDSVPDGVVPIQVEPEISKHSDTFCQDVFGYANDKLKLFLEDHFTAIVAQGSAEAPRPRSRFFEGLKPEKALP